MNSQKHTNENGTSKPNIDIEEDIVNEKIKKHFDVITIQDMTLILGDCKKVLDEMEKNSITLAFTSPPYFNAINYKEHIDKLNGKKDRWERKDVSYKEYKNFLINRFKSLYDVIHPGGHNVVNISPVSWKGKRTPLPFHFVGWMEEIGWQFKEDIVWEKTIARDKRSGVIMQHPYPGYYYPSLVSEYIFVFQKPAEDKKKQNIYWNRTHEEKEENRIELKSYKGEVTKNVWRIRPLSPQENIHPCPFPLEIPERIINFYSYKDDKIIDIFSGSGQALIAAHKLRRRSIGIETQKSYIEYTKKQIYEHFGQLNLEYFL